MMIYLIIEKKLIKKLKRKPKRKYRTELKLMKATERVTIIRIMNHNLPQLLKNKTCKERRSSSGGRKKSWRDFKS
jgi:hypothetical protein